MNRAGRGFRDSYKLENFKSENSYKIRENYKNGYSNNRSRSKGHRYTSKTPFSKVVRRMSLGAATALLAAGIAYGGVRAIGNINSNPEINITKMQEMGKSSADLGLENDTIQTMEKYDEYFENLDIDNVNLTERSVIDMINEIRGLNFDVIKDKMAEKTGVEREDVTFYYDFEKGDGNYYTSILINEGSYDEISFNSANELPFGIGKENHIPQELSDLIVQVKDYDNLISDLQSDSISKVNAVKQLNKLYDNISEFATSELTIDEKGNISIKHFENEKDDKQVTENKEKKSEQTERDDF